MENSKEHKLQVSQIVGANIRNIIQAKKLKPRKISDAVDMDIETLRKYMSGKMEMGISRAVKIAKALEVNIEELFIGT